ncbi:MAG TPA: BNR-4 repeat-containing protein [Tepidisphaeraceae bacterium]|nr:BNR-4 repeat-containing protein [Tepidisphaeraceae bacterium]
MSSTRTPSRRGTRRRGRTAAAVAAMIAAALAATRAHAQDASFSTVAADAYATGDINSCAIGTNNLTTFGGHQFIAYYNTALKVMIGRRALGSSAWQTFDSGLTIASNQVTDDHNVIGIAVDGDGYMHTSWNMHNQSLRYAVSNAPVTGSTLGSINFTTQTAANAPTLFPSGGTTTNSVTYPQFYSIPDAVDSDNDPTTNRKLLLTYRNGGVGGGSGNGNQYFNTYDPSTHNWTNKLVIDGQTTSVNGYLNSLARTSTGEIMMSWTWRATPGWQSNSNIMFARSPDNGTSWKKFDGTAYSLPIIQSGPAASSGEVIKNLPQGSSLINQTSMTVDNADRPIVATWWAPGWNPSTNSGNPNRQYMLVYHDGSAWKTSQVTNRTSDTAIDTSAFAVRDLGRPIVLVDGANRVLVVTRSTDTSMGAHSNPATSDNEIVVYYNTVASLGSASPNPWQSITLDAANMGSWEPTYDAALWKAQKKLSLFYQQVGLGQGASTLKVLDWDPAAYFASLNGWNRSTGGNWDTPGNWTAGVPNAVSAKANFGGGAAPTADSIITLDGTRTVGSLSFGSPVHKYTLTSGASGALAMSNGAGVASTMSVASGSHAINVPVNVGASGVEVAVADGATLTLGGALSGSGPVTKKSGAGTLALSGNNTHSGATSVLAGRLRVLASGALSPNSNVTINGGILETAVNLTRTVGSAAGQLGVTGGVSGFGAGGANATITLQNGINPVSWGSASFNPSELVINAAGATHDLTIAGNLSLNGAARFVSVNAGTNTFSGVISSSTGGLRVDGAGTLVLSNTNTFGGGTIIDAVGQGPGAVRAAANGALGSGSIDIGPQGNGTTARLELANNATLNNAITFRGRTNPSAAIRNVGGNNVLAGAVTLNFGGNVYQVESEAGTLTIAGTLTSAATGARLVALQGAGNGAITGNIQNGSATLAIEKAGSGTWTLSGSNSYTGATTASAGRLVLGSSLISSPAINATGGTVELAAGGAAKLLKTNAVTINGGGKIDLQNHKLAVAGGSLGSASNGDYNGITGLLQDGRAGGAWNGSGIMTGQAAADTGLTSLGVAAATGGQLFGGQTLAAGDIMVMYTYAGDANLDGVLNGDDYWAIDNKVNTPGASGWANGDFDYNGKINGDDYFFLDRNIGRQTLGDFSTAGGISAGGLAADTVAVPEPASIGVAALVAATSIASRRRRSRA